MLSKGWCLDLWEGPGLCNSREIWRPFRKWRVEKSCGTMKGLPGARLNWGKQGSCSLGSAAGAGRVAPVAGRAHDAICWQADSRRPGVRAEPREATPSGRRSSERLRLRRRARPRDPPSELRERAAAPCGGGAWVCPERSWARVSPPESQSPRVGGRGGEVRPCPRDF